MALIPTYSSGIWMSHSIESIGMIASTRPEWRLQKRSSSGQGEMFEYRIVRPDGKTRWLSGIGRLAGPHAPHQFVGVQSDITDRKLNEDRVRHSEHRFQMFMDRSPALASIEDEHKPGTLFQRAVQGDFFPARPSTRANHPFCAPDIVQRLHALDRQALADGSVEAQLTVPTPDGQLHEFQISKFIFRAMPRISAALGRFGMM